MWVLSDCFDASVAGVKEGTFVLQLKCPECGSPKVLFNTGEFEEQLRILVVRKESRYPRAEPVALCSSSFA